MRLETSSENLSRSIELRQGPEGKQVQELLEVVGLQAPMLTGIRIEFSEAKDSGSVIARALVLKPKLIICDEPVSALDVSIQVADLKSPQGTSTTIGLTLSSWLTD